MKCKACGYENNDSSKYCESCGNRMFDPEGMSQETPEPELTVRPEPVEETYEGPADSQVEGMDQQAGDFSDIEDQVISQPVNPYQEEGPKKKKKWPILVVALVLIVAIGAAGVVFGQSLMKSDEERLVDAMKKTSESKQISAMGEFGFNDFKLEGVGVMEAAMVENIIKGLKINYVMMSDTDKYEAYMEMKVKMSGSELIQVGLFLNKEFVAISIPALYDEVVYVNWVDIKDILIQYEIASQEDLEDFDINPDEIIEKLEAYIEALDYRNYESYSDLDVEKYENLMYGTYTDSIVEVEKGSYAMDLDGDTIDFGDRVYTMDLDYGKMYDNSINLYKELIADDAVKPMIHEGLERFFAAVIAQEDDFMFNVILEASDGMAEWDGWKSEYVDKINEIKDKVKEEIDKGYDEFAKEFAGSFEDEEYLQMERFIKDIYGEIDMEMTLVLEDGYYKGQEMTITLNDSIIDAMNDSALVQEELDNAYDPYGMSMGLGMMEDMDILFEIQLYNKMFFKQLDEEIDFEQLPASAVDFSKLSQEDLLAMYMEISENAEKLVGSFSSGF